VAAQPGHAPEGAGTASYPALPRPGDGPARNLAAGLRTTVWDRSPGATAPPSEAGAVVAASPAAAVRDADVMITMLPTAEVVFAGGVARTLAPGADMQESSPQSGPGQTMS
jgi:3-hydroxyisobutyrate dehydrogenase-like beta-hydroxyacid dehydrogenase